MDPHHHKHSTSLLSLSLYSVPPNRTHPLSLHIFIFHFYKSLFKLRRIQEGSYLWSFKKGFVLLVLHLFSSSSSIDSTLAIS
ncbi:hypothetical protein HanXRQr2_Chr10g0436231 [Helianthus annuus]|uniref:Uncharacterized protein n=1 Tax=Helianthus annuus TaxID=4232 RepID=A0A9K3N441_HELAN|nr:hypothetical protein HanXRQr2_Chr10g0436231 [Helianthus annuus]